jgi:NADP-dependent 3-hydroxy acid dehydrogenase YdfG
VNLRDRIVVVRGAGSGIGRATALAFASQGARIAACDIDQSRIDSLAAELGTRVVLARKVDVADRTAMKQFADELHRLVPAADVVVNNAGVGLGASFLDTSLDDWDWILGINLRGVIHGCHFFLPKMVERGTGGHVVNIASILGIYALPNLSAYVATKFAVRGLSEAMRDELAPHKIGVTAICPGLISTAIAADGRLSEKLADKKPTVVKTFSKRGASPGKVADAIVDAVRKNSAVRPVGTDAMMIAALRRVAPGALSRLSNKLQRRFGSL